MDESGPMIAPINAQTVDPRVVLFAATGAVCTELPVQISASYTMPGESGCFCS
jgi:hypothetical protein